MPIMRLAANISMMYGEWPFPQRIQEASADGFGAIECMFPYEFSSEHLAKLAIDAEIKFALINAPAGDWSCGERGLSADPANIDRFKAATEQALQYASALGVKRVHVLAGCYSERLPLQMAWDCYLQNIDWLCTQTTCQDITWLIEPLNHRDVPNYLLRTQARAHEALSILNKSNLKVQMDLYHCQVAEGDVITKLRQYLPTGNVGHIQIAGAPERWEPIDGELNMGRVFDELETLGYRGFVGCEYKPKSSTREGLGWIKRAPFSGKM